MVSEQDKTLTPDLEMWRGYIVGLMKSPAYFMFVAEHENRLVGFIDYCMNPEATLSAWIAVINSFYVAPEFREDASGKLWGTTIESAKGNNAKYFSSTCFAEKLGFWEKHGFVAEMLAIRREL
jgi:GNAT superfamily N-acetyltransferase